MNDDWSYIWSARTLAETGHVIYNGWATAMLGWQLFLGALFIKLFGFSFTVMRVSVLCVAVAATALLHRILLLCGIAPRNAVLGTLCLVLSPLFLPLAFSFMSDVPGLFAILLCVYGCLRALQASSDRSAFAWLIGSALLNTITGTVRQTSWLGVLILVPTTFWLIRHRRHALVVGVVTSAFCALLIFISLRWFSHQPYTLPEPFLSSAGQPDRLARAAELLRNCLDFLLFLLPVTIAFLVRPPWRSGAGTRTLLLAPVLFLLGAAGLFHSSDFDRWLEPSSGNIVSPRGLVDIPQLLDHRPFVLSMAVRAALTCLVLASTVAFLATAVDVWSRSRTPLEQPSISHPPTPPTRTLLIFFGPFTLVYLVLLATRSIIFDRYYLPLLVVAMICALRLLQHDGSRGLPLLCSAIVALFALFGIAGMHDVFAETRARVEAADEVLATGASRSELHAGFDYDAWTQLQLRGYVNDPRLANPAGAYRPVPQPSTSEVCTYLHSDLFPDLRPRFGLAHGPIDCFPLAPLPRVDYRVWLGPRHRTIYILSLPGQP